MIISVIQDISTHKAQPAAGSEDERRYLRYAAARLGAFSNITWDLGDDLDSFRDEKWAHETGTLLESWDPYQHLATSHPGAPRTPGPRRRTGSASLPSRTGRASQHALMLEERADPDEDRTDYSADQRRVRIRGSLSALGARAPGGFGGDTAPDGLGHRHGRRLRHGGRERAPRHQHLAGHRRRLDQRPRRRHTWSCSRATSTWWTSSPASNGGRRSRTTNSSTTARTASRSPARSMRCICPTAGDVTVKLEPGEYRARWYSALTGEIAPLPDPVHGPMWTSPKTPFWVDSALLIERKK